MCDHVQQENNWEDWLREHTDNFFHEQFKVGGGDE